MRIKTPKFWYNLENQGIIEVLLDPLSKVYSAIDTINRNNKKARAVNIPVLCIGNITVGGSGKTPTAIAIAKLLKDNNIYNTPFFLTRGYTGTNKKTRCVSVHDDPSETGDEPIILSRHCKTIISVNRYDGAKLAQANGADCVIMDDGFQNNTLKKDVSILVIDGKNGFGNSKILPAGPLREYPDQAYKRADMIMIIGDDSHGISKTIPEHIPIFFADINPVQKSLNKLDKNRHYLAFAGLGMPSKFHDMLRSLGFTISEFVAFPDHHKYTLKDIQFLTEKSDKSGSILITTQKDILKIPEPFKNIIKVLDIELKIRAEHDFAKKIELYLKR